MSIKGFSVGGNVERYDYNSLDNLPSEITIDTALSDSSTNPVQNRVVTSAINSANGSISSISGEVDDLKSAVDEISPLIEGDQLFDVADKHENTYFNGTTFASNTSYSCTDYIPVKSGKTVYASLNGVNENNIFIIFGLDANFAKVAETSTWTGHITITDKIKYIVVNCNGGTAVSTLMVSYDSVKPYEPYVAPYRISVPAKTSDIENDSGFISRDYVDKFVGIGKNLFNFRDITDGYYINNESAVANADFCYTNEYTEVSENDDIYCTTSDVSGAAIFIALYDSNKAWLSNTTLNSGSGFHKVITNSSAKYARFSVMKSAFALNTLVISKGLLETGAIYGKYYLDNADAKKSIDDIAEKTVRNEIVTVQGDSLAAMAKWCPAFMNEIGMTGRAYTNLGRGGTPMAIGNSEHQTDYIASNARIDAIPSGTTLLIVSFGTNDFWQDVPLGTWADTTASTFRGAMRYFANRVHTNIPLCKIVFLAPTMERSNGTNNLELHKLDYVNAMCEATNEINIPVINSWGNVNFDLKNITNFTSDAIHWNDLGGERVGKYAGKVVSQLL